MGSVKPRAVVPASFFSSPLSRPYVLRNELALMKLSTPFLLILAAAGFVEASHDGLNRMARHNHIAARKEGDVIRRSASGRCKVRATTSVSYNPTVLEAYFVREQC